MTFRVGQKVVCIKRGQWAGNIHGSETLPRRGGIYTIRSIKKGENDLFLRFEEIVNPLYDYCSDGRFIEACFRSSRFRPIVERKTDISFAHEILRKATRKAPAIAPAERSTGGKQ